jgi:drug/metabolite transporter (DMT)-like permease
MTLRTWLLFALLCVFWGIPYFFIKLALVDISPLCVAWGRITLGALVLLPVAWHRGGLKPALQHKRAIVAFAIAELVIPFSLIALAETWLTSSMTGVLIATVPMTVVLIAPLFGVREVMSIRRLGGLLIGFVGVIVLLGFDTASGPNLWLGVGCLVLAIIGYAAGPLIVQRHLAGVDEIGSLAISLVVAAVVLSPFALATLPRSMPAPLSLISIGVLGLISTASALLLYFYVIHAAGAARASVVAYVSPAIAAILGTAVLHEHFGIATIMGLGLILIGSALGSSGAEVPTQSNPTQSNPTQPNPAQPDPMRPDPRP